MWTVSDMGMRLRHIYRQSGGYYAKNRQIDYAIKYAWWKLFGHHMEIMYSLANTQAIKHSVLSISWKMLTQG